MRDCARLERCSREAIARDRCNRIGSILRIANTSDPWEGDKSATRQSTWYFWVGRVPVRAVCLPARKDSRPTNAIRGDSFS